MGLHLLLPGHVPLSPGPAQPPHALRGPRLPQPCQLRQLTKFVNGIGKGSFRVTVLLILLICPSLLSTRHGQHLNACTRAEEARKVVVEGKAVERKRKMPLDLGF